MLNAAVMNDEIDLNIMVSLIIAAFIAHHSIQKGLFHVEKRFCFNVNSN
jgi:hypothetical protein